MSQWQRSLFTHGVRAFPSCDIAGIAACVGNCAGMLAENQELRRSLSVTPNTLNRKTAKLYGSSEVCTENVPVRFLFTTSITFLLNTERHTLR